MWVQAANYEIGEITTWSPLRIHRNEDWDLEMCAKSDLEPFQHHTNNILYEFVMCFLEINQTPLYIYVECTLPGMF